MWGKWPGDILWRLIEEMAGEWGERIPSPDRLRAMREMAAEKPWEGHGHVCHFCGRPAYPTELYGPSAHAPDCSHQRAQPPCAVCGNPATTRSDGKPLCHEHRGARLVAKIPLPKETAVPSDHWKLRNVKTTGALPQELPPSLLADAEARLGRAVYACDTHPYGDKSHGKTAKMKEYAEAFHALRNLYTKGSRKETDMQDPWRDFRTDPPTVDGPLIVHAPSLDTTKPLITIAWFTPGSGLSLMPTVWINAVTHWMPIPDPPTEGDDAE